jgi:hypothetical protein
MSPHAHAIPHYAVYYANAMGTRRRVVRYAYQRVLRLWPVRCNNYACRVVL